MLLLASYRLYVFDEAGSIVTLIPLQQSIRSIASARTDFGANKAMVRPPPNHPNPGPGLLLSSVVRRPQVARQATQQQATVVKPLERSNRAVRERISSDAIPISGHDHTPNRGNSEGRTPRASSSQTRRSYHVDKTQTGAQRLDELNKRIRVLCDVSAEYVGTRKQLPEEDVPAFSLEGRPVVGKAPSGFTSPKDYCFFALSSIINQSVDEYIFLPFHPTANDTDNATFSRTYRSKANTEPQSAAGAWRSNAFRELDIKAGSTRTDKQKFVQIVGGKIRARYVSALQILPPPGERIHPDFTSLLRAILDYALEWNRVAKTEILDHDLNPFTCEVGSPWNPDRMEPCEWSTRPITKSCLIISPVSFGLTKSVALGGKQVTYVQQKAQVFVEEEHGPKSEQGTYAAPTNNIADDPARPANVSAWEPGPSQDLILVVAGNAYFNCRVSPQAVADQLAPTTPMSFVQPLQGNGGQLPTVQTEQGRCFC